MRVRTETADKSQQKVYQSIVQRSSSILADHDWRHMPWPSRKAPFDEVVDFILEAPKFMAQSDSINMLTSPQSILAASLKTISATQDFNTRLMKWYAGFSASHPGGLYHARLSTRESCSDNPELGKVFPVAYHFPSLPIAQTMLYFWMCQVIAHAHLCSQYAKLERLMKTLEPIAADIPCLCSGVTDAYRPGVCLRHFEVRSLVPLGHFAEWPSSVAYNICQSIDYCLQHSNKVYGPATSLPALALVREHWKRSDGEWAREISWVNDTIRLIASKDYRISILGLF
jgi:hypothetical protein